VIGIGLDAVDVDRFRQVLDRRPSIVQRLFTAREQADARSGVDAAPRLAARFAAKEAAMKALGVGLGAIGWHDVEVRRDPGSGAPTLVVGGRAGALAADLGVVRWEVSLTHTARTAAAVVVAL
jgi:holo-[acyl-carrier protein] synthase